MRLIRRIASRNVRIGLIDIKPAQTFRDANSTDQSLELRAHHEGYQRPGPLPNARPNDMLVSCFCSIEMAFSRSPKDR